MIALSPADRAGVDDAIAAALDRLQARAAALGDGAGALASAVAHAAGGGKRVRPALVIAAYRALADGADGADGMKGELEIGTGNGARAPLEAASPPAPRIEIHFKKQSGFLAISVCDHGRGLTKAEAKKLFRPFHQSAREAAHTAPGVGLGLALCRRLARDLGGALTIDHTYAQGACFTLTLPM